MIISLILAMDDNRVIGRGGDLPWHLPADLKHFKATTMGKPILMGRKTFDSIGKPLPGRTNVVVTRDVNYQASGCLVVNSIDGALSAVKDEPEVMIIGGAQLYEQVLPRAHRIYLTEVHASVDGDTWFPELDRDEWREVARVDHPTDERNAHPYSFVELERSQ